MLDTGPSSNNPRKSSCQALGRDLEMEQTHYEPPGYAQSPGGNCENDPRNVPGK